MMKITIESTNKLTTIDGVPCRLWEGVTESGKPCKVYVHLIAHDANQDQEEFDRELKTCMPPAELFPFKATLN